MKTHQTKKNISYSLAACIVLSACAGAKNDANQQTEQQPAAVTADSKQVDNSLQETLAKMSPEARHLLERLRSEDVVDGYAPQSYVYLGMAVKERLASDGAQKGYEGEQVFKQYLGNLEDTASTLKAVKVKFATTRNQIEFGVDSRAKSLTLRDLTLSADSATNSSFSIITQAELAAIAVEQNKSFKGALSVLTEASQKAAKKFIAAQLSLLSTDELKQWEAIDTSNSVAAKAFFMQKMHPWSQQATDFLGSEQIPMARSAFDTTLVNTVLSELSAGKKIADLADQDAIRDVAKNGQQLALIHQAMIQYSQENQRLYQELSEAQQSAQEILVESQKVAQQGLDSGTPKDQVLGAKTPVTEAAVLAFGSSAVDSVINKVDQKRYEIVKKWGLVEKREKILETSKNIIGGGELLLNIADKLGVDKGVIDAGRKAADVGTKAANFLSALTQEPGVTGLVKGVVGLLGGLGPDLEEVRHNEVMQGLQGLSRGQESMIKMQRAEIEGQQQLLNGQQILLDGQQQIMETQQALLSYSEQQLKTQKVLIEGEQKIYEGIVKVSEQIAANQNQLLSALDAIQELSVYNIRLSTAILDQDNENCSFYIDGISVISSEDNFVNSLNRFSSFSSMDHYLSRDMMFSSLQSCKTAVNKVLVAQKETTLGILGYGFHSDGDKADTQDEYPSRNSINKKTFEAAYQFMQNNKPSDVATRKKLLTMPSNKTTSVDEKQKISQQVNVKLSSESLFMQRLSVSALELHVDAALKTFAMYDLFGSGHNGTGIRPIESLLNNSEVFGRGESAKQVLEGALALTNTAIAQEALVAGDQILDVMYQQLMSGVAFSCSTVDSAPGCLLQNNDVLRKNFVLYAVKRNLSENQQSLLSYGFALNLVQPDPQGGYSDSLRAIKNVLPSSWDLQVINIGGTMQFVLSLGNLKLPLPSVDELDADRMTYCAGMTRLLALKGKIMDALASINFVQNLEQGDRAKFTALLLRGI